MSMLQHGLSEDNGYTVNQSLRFRASNSAHLSRTPISAGNRQKWTWSGWVKRGSLIANNALNYQGLFGSASYGAYASYNSTGLMFNDSHQLIFYTTNSVGNIVVGATTLAVFRDVTSHYHIVLVVDTNQPSVDAGLQIFVNGIKQTLHSTFYTQNTLTFINYNGGHYIGDVLNNNGTTNLNCLFDGYLSEIYFIDGQALGPEYFGQTDPATGVWVPKKYTGTYGNNGFYLPFNDATSLTTLGYDRSGNGNNWTCNGISITAGATYDVMKDSPTNGPNEVGNYATLNPLHAGRSTLTNGNLTASGTTDLPTIMPDSGTWYFEIDGVSKTWTPPAAFPAAAGNYNFGQRPFTNTATHPRLHTGNISDATPVTTSGTFTGNASTDGPCIFINGTPTAMTINSNAVTFATHADKLAGGFKLRTSSASYNSSGANTYSITTNSGKFKNARAQANP